MMVVEKSFSSLHKNCFFPKVVVINFKRKSSFPAQAPGEGILRNEQVRENVRARIIGHFLQRDRADG